MGKIIIRKMYSSRLGAIVYLVISRVRKSNTSTIIFIITMLILLLLKAIRGDRERQLFDTLFVDLDLKARHD
jgi:hypothetical protein